MATTFQLLMLAAAYADPLLAAREMAREQGRPHCAMAMIRAHQRLWGKGHALQAEAVVEVACFHIAKRSTQDADRLLNELQADYTDRNVLANALYRIGGAYKNTYQPKRALECWTTVICLAREAKDWDVILRTENAKRYFAEAYEQLGDWEESNRLWRLWTPHSLCGNCRAHLLQTKSWHIVLNLIRLGRHNEAAVECWKHISNWSHGDQADFGCLLVQLYSEAGQMDDLHRAVDSLERAQLKHFDETWKDFSAYSREKQLSYTTTRSIREAMLLRSFANPSGLSELMRICDENPGDSVRGIALTRQFMEIKIAGDALASLGAQAVKEIRAKADREKWLPCVFLYALGKIGDPAALELLIQLATEKPGTQDAAEIVYALSMHGRAGMKVLHSLSDSGGDDMRFAAKRQLDTMDAPALYTLPRAKANALPKELNAAKRRP